MDKLVVLFVIYLISVLVCNVSSAEDTSNCIEDDNGDCLDICPPGTYTYSPQCEDGGMSQRTCDEPVARPIVVGCDYSRCDCPDTLVWDESRQICVPFENCTAV